MRETTIAVVTALSPSATTLAEYGLHFLRALGARPGLRVVALVEDEPHAYPEISGVSLVPTWRFDDLRSAWRIARAARRVGADVVILNAHFASFGSSRLAAALGLCAPALMRASGLPVITLLHNIVESVDLSAAGFGRGRFGEALLRAAGTCVTWMALRSSLVATTMPGYVDTLRRKYRAGNVAWLPHGTFEAPAAPEARTGAPVLLAFGKFGTYKRVEPVIEAMRALGRADVSLVIAGTDSPNAPGYLADVERRYAGSDVRFVGYVPEDDVERIFREAHVAVFPYSATTGSSGVLHQAGSYGCPVVMARVGDLEDLVAEEGYTGVFFEPDDVRDLTRALSELLDEPGRARAIAAHNHAAACGLTIDMVVDLYLLHIAVVRGLPASALLGTPPSVRGAAAVRRVDTLQLHKVP